MYATIRLSFLVFVAALPLLTGCSRGKPAEVKEWYTTGGPLPTGTGEIRLNAEGGQKLVFVVVDAQFPSRKVWKETGKGEGLRYEMRLTDIHLETMDGQSIPGRLNRSGNTWSSSDYSYTDDPDNYSHWTLAFAVEAAAVEKGGLKLTYKDMPPIDLPAEKRSANR